MKNKLLELVVLILGVSASLTTAGHPGTAQESRRKETRTALTSNEKTVDQVGKNIKVLNGLPQSKLYPVMRFMAASLGFQCGNCHVIKDGRIDAPLDEKPEKQTARQMIKMVIEINKTTFEGNTEVSCYTCHRGQRTPVATPALPLQVPSPRSASNDGSTATVSLPSADEVLKKYLTTIGSKTAIDSITSCKVKGTTTTAIGKVVDYEAEQSAPDKGRESFAIQNVAGSRCVGDSRCEYERVINGKQGWLKSGAGVQELLGEQLGDQKLSFLLFSILKLRDQYSSFRVSRRDKIEDQDVYVVSAIRFDGRSENLYFAVESGLLIRRISYMRTLIGTIPQQSDFDDYRDVGGIRLPFMIRMAFADPGSTPIIRKFMEIKLNAPVDQSAFERPQ